MWGSDVYTASLGKWPPWCRLPAKMDEVLSGTQGYVFETKTSHLDGGHRLWSGMERDGLRHVTLPKTNYMKMTTTVQSMLAQSSPGTRTTPSVAGHQDRGEKYATDGPKFLRARNNITIGTWNVISLRAAGKVEELTHEMERCRWNILWLWEESWKNFGVTTTPEGHKLFSVVVKTDKNMELDSSFTKTLWMPSWDANQSLADSLPFVWRHHLLTSPSSKLMPQQLTMMMMTLKSSTINCKKSQTRCQRKTSL